MIHIFGPKDPKHPDLINTTSRAKGWSRAFSPFLLGPVDLYDGYTAVNVENGWQYSKCYPDVYPSHADDFGNPTTEYFDWAKNGWSEIRAHRYPVGKGKKPLCVYWDGARYDYITSKMFVYITLYAKAVVGTPAFVHLKSIYKTLGELFLWDFDAYDHISLGMDYNDVIHSETKKYGHAFVLAMLLDGFIDEKGEIT